MFCCIEDFFISETQNGTPHLFNQNGSYSILFYLTFHEMVATINFYDKFFLQTNEVCDVIINDVLPSKFDTQSPTFQKPPQINFRLCGIVPILLGKFFQ